jgi:hypothetical protein
MLSRHREYLVALLDGQVLRVYDEHLVLIVCRDDALAIALELLLQDGPHPHDDLEERESKV